MAMKLYDLMSNSPVVEYLGDWPEGEEEVDWFSYVVFPSQWWGPDIPDAINLLSLAHVVLKNI